MLGKGLYVDGGAAVRKLRNRHAVKLAGTTEKRRTLLSEHSAKLIRTVLLSRDVENICDDLLVFLPAGLENGHFSFES